MNPRDGGMWDIRSPAPVSMPDRLRAMANSIDDEIETQRVIIENARKERDRLISERNALNTAAMSAERRGLL
jgi:conjugal transfer/entry exclusion protein